MGVEHGEVLTRKQQERRDAKEKQRELATFKALEKLVAAPEVKDLLEGILLGTNPEGTESGNNGRRWDALYLTPSGLKWQTGADFNEKFYGVWDHIHEVNELAVQPSIHLVSKYLLAERPLRDLLAKLKA